MFVQSLACSVNAPPRPQLWAGYLNSQVEYLFADVLRRSVALAGLAAHLSEIRSTAELELQNQRTVGHFVDVLAFIPVRDWRRVTLALTLLHGGGAEGLGTFV